ncbi:MAG: glycerate kinase [Dehalococcoidia bacterium]
MTLRVLIAPQEFKGSLSARAAARAMAQGLRRALPDALLDILPVADGGPGTVEALVEAASGDLREITAQDPLGRPVQAAWGLLPDGTAVIEMAAASGLSLLTAAERDPRRASTYGTGQLIRAALDTGCQRIIVGVGGSATNDGGAGAAQALGARLLDAQNKELPPGGAALARLARIDASSLDQRLADCQVLVATDVTNPLCGAEGASMVYGPQKGADPELARQLDAALAHYARVLQRNLGVDVAERPGAGAAGGLAAGLVAFAGAEIRSGFELVAEAVGLRERLREADLALTGEGRLDLQTGYGKTTAGVAGLAREAGVPVIALVGGLAEGYDVSASPFHAVLAITSGPISLEEAQARAADLVAAAAEQVGRLVRVGQQLRR